MNAVAGQKEHDYHIARNMVAQKQFADIAILFLKNRIQFMPLKGIVFIDTVYTHLDDRFLTDIDILVRKEDLPAIHTIMQSLGYGPSPDGPLGWMPRDDAGIPIDFHDDIWYMSSSELRILWRKGPIKIISGIPCQIMPIEDSIVFVIAHAFIHHGHAAGAWREDLIRIFNQNFTTIALPYLIDMCRRYNMLAPFMYAFSMIQHEISTTAGIKAIQYLMQDDKFLFKQKLLTLCISFNHPLKGHLMRLIFQRNVFFMIRFIFRSLFPNRYFMRRRYNVSSFLGLCKAYSMRPFYFLYYTGHVIKRFIFQK